MKPIPLPCIPSFYFSILFLYFAGDSVGSSIIPGRDVSPFASVRTVPVFIVEDLRIPSIIPSEPELPILIEDDDDPPVSFGFEESEELRRRLWVEKRPHRVYGGDVRGGGGAGAEGGMGERKNEAGDGMRDSEREGGASGEWIVEGEIKASDRKGSSRGRGESEGEKEGEGEGEGVYSTVAAALSEAFSIASGRFTKRGSRESGRVPRGENYDGNCRSTVLNDCKFR